MYIEFRHVETYNPKAYKLYQWFVWVQNLVHLSEGWKTIQVERVQILRSKSCSYAWRQKLQFTFCVLCFGTNWRSSQLIFEAAGTASDTLGSVWSSRYFRYCLNLLVLLILQAVFEFVGTADTSGNVWICWYCWYFRYCLNLLVLLMPQAIFEFVGTADTLGSI
jgi:hypothetical protein